MKTTRMTLPNEVRVQRFDATRQPLGRLATRVANALRGKGKVSFVHHRDSGDRVIVEHASRVVLTGNKPSQKVYQRHTGYLSHVKTKRAEELIKTNPSDVVRRAVVGMLPKNRLRPLWLQRLTIWAQEEGGEHDR